MGLTDSVGAGPHVDDSVRAGSIYRMLDRPIGIRLRPIACFVVAVCRHPQFRLGSVSRERNRLIRSSRRHQGDRVVEIRRSHR